MNNQKKVIEATGDLLDNAAPHEWISFLFEIQNSLIYSGYLEGFNPKASQDFAGKFGALKYFFEVVRN